MNFKFIFSLYSTLMYLQTDIAEFSSNLHEVFIFLNFLSVLQNLGIAYDAL